MMSAMTEFVLEDESEMTHDCVTLTYAATSEIAENSHRETQNWSCLLMVQLKLLKVTDEQDMQ